MTKTEQPKAIGATSMLGPALAPAAAVFVFGAIYGSLARPLLGAGATIASSLLIFSGSVQFTIVALLSAGAGAAAIVAGATTLNVRNLVLGAVLRPRVEASPAKRAALGWWLTDESAGLALASSADPARVLLVSGALLYVAWQAGTAVGLMGASFDAVKDAATAVFPVLFIGLAALSCRSKSQAVRAAVAGAATAGGAYVWPGSKGLVAVAAAIMTAIPGARE